MNKKQLIDGKNFNYFNTWFLIRNLEENNFRYAPKIFLNSKKGTKSLNLYTKLSVILFNSYRSYSDNFNKIIF